MALKFDLIDEAWIPCVDKDGKACELGVRDVLMRAHELREIYDDSPPKTVVIHRLILAVLHRCWSSDSEEKRAEEWEEWWQRKNFAAAQIEAYLQTVAHCFDLFNPTNPFYQIAGLTVDGLAAEEATSIVGLELRQKNNPTLFDHNTESNPPFYTLAQAARALLMAQSYVVSGTGSRDAYIGEQKVKTPSNFEQGNLTKGVAVWLSGANLFETLMLNLIPHDAQPNDLPIWERSVEDQIRFATSFKPRTQPETGILDRLTWQSRMIRLLPENTSQGVVVRRALFAQGRSATENQNSNEEMKSYTWSLKFGLTPVSLNANKATWRDAHSLFSTQNRDKRPAALDFAAQHTPSFAGEKTLLAADLGRRLNVVGLATDKAKILLWRHDRMPAPAAILNDVDLVDDMRSANDDAEWVAGQMNERMRRVCRLFLAPECETGEGRTPHHDDVTRLTTEFDPRRAYWPRLEAHFHQFLYDLPNDRFRALETWRDNVQSEAERSFQKAARALGTSPRAVRAAAHVGSGFRTKGRFDDWLNEQKSAKKAKKTEKVSPPDSQMVQHNLFEEVTIDE